MILYRRTVEYIHCLLMIIKHTQNENYEPFEHCVAVSLAANFHIEETNQLLHDHSSLPPSLLHINQ
ncbi:hypothetical protein Hanom_Chr01g00046951 [Helianthus anomalus]